MQDDPAPQEEMTCWTDNVGPTDDVELGSDHSIQVSKQVVVAIILVDGVNQSTQNQSAQSK